MSVAVETEAYAAYVNGARAARLDSEAAPWDDELRERAEQLEADRDLAHARLLEAYYS